MYAGVPRTWPSTVSVSSTSARKASPKSITSGRPLAIGFTRQEAGMRKLQGDDPIQFHVPRPPDRSKGAQADALEQLELAQGPHEFGRGGLPRVPKPERAAAGRAENFLMSLVLS